MSKASKSWEKRLSGKPDQLSIDFVESLSYDRRLYKYDIAGSIAHAKMLSEQKIIKKDEFRQIKKGLLEISEEIKEDKFRFNRELEDIHMAIESALVEKIGGVGKKLHTGRSRNDQVATDIRLWMRDQIEILQAKITGLQKAFVKLAEKYTENIMPAYTHLQRAQPIVISAYLLSFFEQLQRDYIRFANCSDLLNVSPLGSGAIAGTTVNLSRDMTAEELGFKGTTPNSIDSVSDRDFCAEFIFDCSLTASHLSKLAEDWIIYSSNEFDFVKINDKYCTSSSMMPQKRNPDMLELIRAKTASVYGALTAMLTILKAQPTGYNRDLQEDKLHVFKASDVIEACLDMATAIVNNTRFNIKKIEESIDEGYLDATSLAEYLVSKGVPFRQAHGIVGELVTKCEKKDKRLKDVTLEEFRAINEKINEDVYGYLGAENVVKKYSTKGAAGSSQSKKRIEHLKKIIKQR